MIVMFVDISGFTALAEAHGDDHAVRVVGEVEGLVRETAVRHGMEYVKSAGDAFIVLSEQAGSAYSAALELLHEIDHRPGRPCLHIGLHAGDVVRHEGDVLGRAVNVAARVAGHAQPNQLVLTDQAMELVPANLREGARRLGWATLRNLPRRVQLWHVSPGSKHPVTDPVCRMTVDPDRALRLRMCKQDYFFCSTDCMEAFKANPKPYRRKKTLSGLLKEVTT